MISPERREAETRLPTKFGDFALTLYTSDDGDQSAVLSMGTFERGEHVPVRVHTECLVGDVFGSELCDCRQKFRESLEYIEERGRGVVIYLRDGEGTRIVVDSPTLCLPPEERHYQKAANILADLGVKREED